MPIMQPLVAARGLVCNIKSAATPCCHRRASLNITQTNRRIAEQFSEAFNRSDLDAAASCFAEDCQTHGRKVGRAGVRAVLGEIKTNFPDEKLTTLNSVAEGEWVVFRCTYSGTHRGTSRFPVDGGMLVGVQPTGRTFEVQHIHMYRVLMARSQSTLRIGTMLE